MSKRTDYSISREVKKALVISDLHFPYQHPDAIDFLYALHDYFDFDTILNVGDIVDNHYPSFHEKEPDCYGGSEEIERASEGLQELESIFPEMLISLGNHDLLPRRKANAAQIPLEHVADPNLVYGLQGGWDWREKHYVKLPKKRTLLVTHSVGANIANNAKLYSHCSVQGHHHGTYGLQYFGDHDLLRWHFSTGCLINPKAPAFRYDKKMIVNRPVIGCGYIINGVPYPAPMDLKANGRWTGSLL